MFNRILVPLDGSPLAERVIPHARHFARTFGGSITLLQVLDPAPYSENASAVEPLNWQIRKTEADLYLKGVAARLREQGIQAEHVVREGRASDNIVDFAHSENIDLLVLSTHGSSGLSRWNINAISMKVMEKAYLPVLLVRAYQIPGKGDSQAVSTGASGEAAAGSAAPGTESRSSAGSAGAADSTPGNIPTQNQRAAAGAPAPAAAIPATGMEGEVAYHRILLPIDSSRRAECALPAAIGLAKGENTSLLLAAVIEPPILPIPGPYPADLQQLSEQFMKASREIVQNYVNEMKSRLPFEAETRVVENDSVPAAIHDLVEKENIDLVILCAHGKTGHINWPYGSVARNYIEHGTQPVLVIQDVRHEQVRPTAAEIAAEKYGRR